jgi:hypothetical protein
MKITYNGDAELVSEFGALLTGEGLDVGYFTEDPVDQTEDAHAVQIFEAKMPGPVPAWATTLANAEAAVSKFHERFPDAHATIEFDGEQSDLNTPPATEGSVLGVRPGR